MYSMLEQHTDGSWWYHPGATFQTEEECEEWWKEAFWWDLDRPHRIFEHEEPFPQKISLCSRRLKVFHFQGRVNWPKKLKGEDASQYDE